MANREHDPELAARSVRELAALTDAELAADVRAAAVDVSDLAETWRDTPGWPFTDADRRAYAAVAATRAALAELGEDAPLDGLVAGARPILNAWWPEQPSTVTAVSRAVERLRHAAKIRPSLVAEARVVVAAGLV